MENILIVDDKNANLVLLEHNLNGLGLNVVKAKSGQEALDKINDFDFALVLLDVQMPGMSGFETAEAIRKNPATKYVPIIFITAMCSQDALKFQGYESGAVDYLIKPVEEQILKSKVKIFIELYQQKKLIEKQREELSKKVEALKKAMEEIKALQGIIPICVHCKKIRDDQGFWESVEKYIESHTDVGFSHGICPDCLTEHFPEYAEEILGKKKK
jgi:CheY-like chemotaxis protein